jgi:hypothetical protein
MSEKHWAKVFPVKGVFFKFKAELYENEQLDDTMSIAKQIASKKFLTPYAAKMWVEKKILNEQQSFFVKDYEILRRSWNG